MDMKKVIDSEFLKMFHGIFGLGKDVSPDEKRAVRKVFLAGMLAALNQSPATTDHLTFRDAVMGEIATMIAEDRG